MRSPFIPMFLLVILLGCSGSGPSSPAGGSSEDAQPEILGSWEVVEVDCFVSGKLIPPTKRILCAGRSYVRIDEDHFWLVNEQGVGFRREYRSSYSYDDALELEHERFDVREEDGLLHLSGGTIEFVLERSETIPNVALWIRDFVIDEGWNTPAQASGDLAFDGEDIWIAGGPPGKEIIRFDLSSRSAVPIDVSGAEPTAIAFRDGRVYVNHKSESDLYTLNLTTKQASDTGLDMGTCTTSLIDDGATLLGVSACNLQIEVLDTENDRNLFRVDVGVGFQLAGGCHGDDRLLLVADGTVTEFRPVRVGGTLVRLEPLGAFRLRGLEIVGITYDGDHLWANARSDDTGGHLLARIRFAS